MAKDTKDATMPDFIKKHKELSKKAGKVVEEARHVHMDAYKTGYNKIGKDLEKLESPADQDKFVDAMVDHYVRSAAEEIGIKGEKLDDFKKDLILDSFYGVTRAKLKELVGNYGKKYSLQLHENVREKLLEDVNNKLQSTAAAHIKNEHIGDIIKYTGIEGKVVKETVGREKAIALLGEHHQEGYISDSTLRKLGIKKYKGKE